MRKIPGYIFIITLLTICLNSQAQKNIFKYNLVQLNGRLLNELLQPLPYAHVLDLNNFRGSITDREGKYSFVVHSGDSIMYSTVGYKRKIIVIPEDLPEPFYTLDLALEPDTLWIKEVVVYPWKTYEEFKRAFVNLELPSSDLENARRNIALLKTQIIMDEIPSVRGNFQMILDDQYRETFNQGMYPTYRLFNAVNWIDFFKALKRGDFSKYRNNSD
jgi:hypothetical protein